jgi:hypothetical protein
VGKCLKRMKPLPLSRSLRRAVRVVARVGRGKVCWEMPSRGVVEVRKASAARESSVISEGVRGWIQREGWGAKSEARQTVGPVMVLGKAV